MNKDFASNSDNDQTLPQCRRAVEVLGQMGWVATFYVVGPVHSPTPYPSPMDKVYYERDLIAAGVEDTDPINAVLSVEGSPMHGGIGVRAINFLLNRGGPDSLAHIITGIQGRDADVQSWMLRIMLAQEPIRASLNKFMQGK